MSFSIKSHEFFFKNSKRIRAKFTLFLCLTISLSNYAQSVNTTFASQINSTFNGVDKTKVPYKLLKDYAMEFTELAAYNGVLTNDNIVHRGHYESIYSTLLMARVNTNVTGLYSPTTFQNRWESKRAPNKIVLSGLYYKYSKFKENAYPNYITISNNKLYDKYVNGVWRNPYETKQVFAMSAPIVKYNSLTMQVEVPSTLWYTNQASAVQSIAVDFGNGQGYLTMSLGQIRTINYTQAGFYEWKYKLTLTNGQILYSHSKIEIDGVVVPSGGASSAKRGVNEPCDINEFGIDEVEFTGTRSYLGKVGEAIIEINYVVDCELRNPLIVFEGYDTGLLNAENPLGDSDYNSFIREATFNSGDLGIELNNYDIVYVNWVHGRDYLQRNAYLLEDIIKWVNSIKIGNAPNVILGQSMGGILARYALKDMENRNEAHETSLYISHDAPHQGANVPVSFLYAARHVIDQFVATPLGDFNVSQNGGDFSIKYIKSVLDDPGTKQMLKNYVTGGFVVDNTASMAWQNELEAMGYPQGYSGNPIRNIAISNGNHCALPQDFDPNDTLMSLDGNGKTSFLSDLIVQVLSALVRVDVNTFGFVGLAISLNEPGLLLGVIPGRSEFNIEMVAKALPDVNTTKQIYKGKVTFTKKILGLINVTVTLTNRSYNNPPGILPYDYYPGGQINIPNDFNGTSTSNVFGSRGISVTLAESFDFIPVPSALDVGEGVATLNNYDYLVTYKASLPPTAPKEIPFDNFTTSHEPNTGLNERHVSFNTRNGNWLAEELDGDTNTNIFDCTSFCSNARITGSASLCTTATYSVTSQATTVTWNITQGANLVTTSISGNQITLQANANANGDVTLEASYSNDECGSANVTKTIKVGTPSFPSTGMTGDDNPITGAYKTYTVPTAIAASNYSWYFDVGGVTGTSVGGWEILTGQGSKILNVKVGNPGLAVIVCKVSNACGSAYKYLYVNVRGSGGNGGGGNDPGDCEPQLKVYPNPVLDGETIVAKVIYPDPCDELILTKTTPKTVKVYNIHRKLIHSKKIKTNEFRFNSKGLKKGVYIIEFTTEDGRIFIQKFLKH